MSKFDSKREMIKAAGIKSFAMFGYQKTTLVDIAGMINMKKNSLYYYFESKDALFKEIIEDTIAEHYGKTEEILNSDRKASEKFFMMIDCLSKFIMQRTTDYTVKISSYLEISKVIRNSFPDFQKKEIGIITKILEEGIKNNEFVSHDTNELARDISELIPAIFTYNYLNSETEFVKDVNFDNIIKQIRRHLTYILNGLKKKK
jgi:TetR/AcrR family transcriptional regulator